MSPAFAGLRSLGYRPEATDRFFLDLLVRHDIEHTLVRKGGGPVRLAGKWAWYAVRLGTDRLLRGL